MDTPTSHCSKHRKVLTSIWTRQCGGISVIRSHSDGLEVYSERTIIEDRILTDENPGWSATYESDSGKSVKRDQISLAARTCTAFRSSDCQICRSFGGLDSVGSCLLYT